ncbi:IS3 family transposase [Moraxella osloensis]|uniref:IS3 family transposase n=1 Tax=Faucicola osloensis TaxID=34062 RepID=UPI0039B6F094
MNLNLWVKQAYDQTKGSGGARTLSAMVSKQYGIKLTRYKAGKIMAQQGLISRQLIRHRYSKADKEHAICDNLLKRE